MTAIDLGTILSWPSATHPDPPQPTGPWAPRTDSDMPVAVDPALNGWEPPTLDDLGLTADPVAIALNVLRQLTDADRATVLDYYRPQSRPDLKAVA